ncbi:hypothetical protein HMPREF1863_00251 [Aedoeadaptatus coxii]|uniref:Uncharacterized protein n=1 Tax=Aedoeadaptatus coxii TaxID=755172 RepID=A0A134AL11_9FIRM|nr:hypothetical protein HMPREF1863_00251 [Peptoniphilus coxii]
MGAGGDTFVAVHTFDGIPHYFFAFHGKGGYRTGFDAIATVNAAVNGFGIVAIHAVKIARLQEYSKTIPGTVDDAHGNQFVDI